MLGPNPDELFAWEHDLRAMRESILTLREQIVCYKEFMTQDYRTEFSETMQSSADCCSKFADVFQETRIYLQCQTQK